ncbi:MAG: hypothetical protein C4519_22135 [Desulfobacteraceae bacterium]|nr:MAG: hypothetical protein C4519_22135 [Desulfobacteraceae bacterium]
MSTTNIFTSRSFLELLQQERARVHRNGQQFSLILFRLAEHADLSAVVHPIMLPAILKRIRKIDQVGLYDEKHIGLLLPHTARDGARKVAGDLYQIQPIASNIAGCEFYMYP